MHAGRNAKYFEAHVGEQVSLVGRVATVPWEHMTASVPGKVLVYVDLDGGKKQIVGHFERQPTCSGEIAIEGKILEVRGPSKRAIRGGSGAAGDQYSEYAVDVMDWRCLRPATH